MNIKKGEVKDVYVSLISILHDEMKPSNEEEVIIKSGEIRRELKCEVIKTEAIEGKLTCIAMKSDTMDTQGEWYSKETVKKTAESFIDHLANEMKKNSPSDTNHNMVVADGVRLLQSWVEEGEVFMWKCVLDISGNETLMQKAKDGKITGVSIYGKGVRVEKSVIQSAKEIAGELFKAMFMKSTKESYDERQKQSEIWAELDMLDNAWYSFKDNVISWQEWETSLKVDSAGFNKEVDELASVLKTMKFNKLIKKGDLDMKKDEAKAFLDTEEGKTVLKEMGYELKAAEPTKTQEGNTADGATDTVAKSEFDAVILAKTKAETDLEKATQDLKAAQDKLTAIEKERQGGDDKSVVVTDFDALYQAEMKKANE